MKTKYLTSLLFLVVACSGGQTSGGDGGESVVELKKAAADAKANQAAQGDACQQHGWYGDGECDRFCAAVDSVDCTPTAGDAGGVVCALFIEEANGVCGRKPTDPCKSQDPDCDDIICTAIAREADGKCDTESNDPCLYYQDPDCRAFDPPPSGPRGDDDPIVCPAILLEKDGVCADSTDPCHLDPDCAVVVCPAILLEKDGVCADSTDPCHLDPDCTVVEPQPPGGTPSDPGTPTCKASASSPDGVCSLDPKDACFALDPDCVPVACLTYIELPDGVCKREPSDPCIFQDPDCNVK
jgi:hypothetical protein